MEKLTMWAVSWALVSLLGLSLIAVPMKISSQEQNLNGKAIRIDATGIAGEPKYPTEGVDPFQPDPVVRQLPGYELVWHDEFNIEGPPDPQKWNFEHGFVRNRELQWYQRENAYCKGGVLVIGGLWRWENGKWTKLHDDPFIYWVAVHPRNPLRLVIATNDHPYHDRCFAMGIWVSSDGGRTWQQANDGLACLRVSCVAFNPHDPTQIICGTLGSGFFMARWR